MESSAAAPAHQGVVPAGHGFLWPETAGKWENGPSSDPEPDYTREPGQLVLARILLAQDRPGQVFALLGWLIAGQRAGQAAAGIPFGYLARLQRAFAAGPPAPDPGSSGIIDR